MEYGLITEIDLNYLPEKQIYLSPEFLLKEHTWRVATVKHQDKIKWAQERGGLLKIHVYLVPKDADADRETLVQGAVI